jgi:hypothetical protein
MENKSKKIYPSQQLVCSLDANVLKCLMWLLGWQSQGDIKIYVKQMSKFLHMDEEIIELCIQTLEDVHLIDIKRVDQTWIANLNAEQIQKYFNIPMEKIKDGNGIQMASEVTWNQEVKVEVNEASNDIEDMSEQDLKRLLLRIEASLSEKQQLKSKIVNNQDNEVTDLPF